MIIKNYSLSTQARQEKILKNIPKYIGGSIVFKLASIQHTEILPLDIKVTKFLLNFLRNSAYTYINENTFV